MYDYFQVHLIAKLHQLLNWVLVQLHSGVSGVAFFFNFTAVPRLYFQDVHPDVLEAYVIWLDSRDQGKWVKSIEINPAEPRKLTKADLYTKEERKKLKPSEDCQVMFLQSNSEAKCVIDFLKREFKRKVKEVSYDGNCMFSSVLA